MRGWKGGMKGPAKQRALLEIARTGLTLRTRASTSTSNFQMVRTRPVRQVVRGMDFVWIGHESGGNVARMNDLTARIEGMGTTTCTMVVGGVG